MRGRLKKKFHTEEYRQRLLGPLPHSMWHDLIFEISYWKWKWMLRPKWNAKGQEAFEIAYSEWKSKCNRYIDDRAGEVIR